MEENFQEESLIMKKEKIGVIFFVSILALAGIGISYAGFSDSINVYGTVSTASVNIDWIDWFSGTWVYKIWDFGANSPLPPGNPFLYDLENEILIYKGFIQLQPTEDEVLTWANSYGGKAKQVACSYAMPGGLHTDSEGNELQYDVDMVYNEIFPCIDFCADFLFHYDGSIPAKINFLEFFSVDQWLDDLWAMYEADPDAGFGAWAEAFRAYPIYQNPDDTSSPIIDWTIDENDPVDEGYQIHNCYYIYVKLCIHLPQDNIYEGLSGKFYGKISAIQWNECDDVIDLPPTLEIYEMENGNGWYIYASATDDYGIVSTGYLWEWMGGSETASSTVDPPQTVVNSIGGYFWLHDGWNRITLFAYDTAGQRGEVVVELTYP